MPMQLEYQKWKAELDALSRKIEKSDPPVSDQERKDWDQKRKEMFKSGEIKASLLSEVIKVDFASPELLRAMSDKQLLEFDDLLHELYEKDNVNKESIINAHVFLLDEFFDRSLKHSDRGDDLDQDSEKWESS